MGLNIEAAIANQFQSELVENSAFVADNATILGHVEIADLSSVWFGCVIRGDSDKIKIGKNTNIQDMSVIHTDAGIVCSIGDRVTIGHAAIVHGATVANDALIGMRSVVMNRAEIGSGSIVAPGSIVTEGSIIPENSVVMGIPGKVVRETNAEDQARIDSAWKHYVELSKLHKKTSLERPSLVENLFRKVA